jgi:hypothetical protein
MYLQLLILNKSYIIDEIHVICLYQLVDVEIDILIYKFKHAGKQRWKVMHIFISFNYFKEAQVSVFVVTFS